MTYREVLEPDEPVLEWYCPITLRRRYRIMDEGIFYLFVLDYHSDADYGWDIFYDDGSSCRQKVSFWKELKLKWKLRKLLKRLS